MDKFTEREMQIVSLFNGLQAWEDRYKKIIELGKALPDLPENLRTEQAKVKGCQSQVWLHAKLTDQGTVELQGDSDAMIVKGLVAILLRVYSGLKPSEILSHQPQFLKTLGFEGNLSPSRTNGLYSMIKQILLFAQAFAMMEKAKQK